MRNSSSRALGAMSLAFLLALPLAGNDADNAASTELPAPPAVDLRALPCAAVLQVRAGNELIVQLDGQPMAVRLIGTYVPGRGPDADAARAFVARLLAGESVRLAGEPGWSDRDGEPCWRHVYRHPDGLYVNLELLRQGYARFSAGGPIAHDALLRAYERLARRLDKGVWDRVAPAPASQPTACAAANVPETPEAAAPELGGAPAADAAADEPRVYVTANGRKYHRADCQYVRNGAKALPLSEAKALGYTPCSRCKPPE